MQVAPHGEQRKREKTRPEGRLASLTTSQRQATKSRYAKLCVRTCQVLTIRQKNESGSSKSTLRWDAPRLPCGGDREPDRGECQHCVETGQNAEPAGGVDHVEEHVSEPLLVDDRDARTPDRPHLVVGQAVLDDRAAARDREPRILVDLPREANDERDREDRGAQDEQRLVDEEPPQPRRRAPVRGRSGRGPGSVRRSRLPLPRASALDHESVALTNAAASARPGGDLQHRA